VAVADVLFYCTACGHQASVTAGMIFQDTRSPLRLWFRAMLSFAVKRNLRRN